MRNNVRCPSGARLPDGQGFCPADGGTKVGFIYGLCFCLLSASIVFGGCESLHRKFTRKKKKEVEQSQDIPVLEPMEYPQKISTPEDVYRQNYSMWRAWQRELSDSFTDNTYRKRQVYLINQVINNLQKMMGMLQEDQASAMAPFIARLEKIRKEIESIVPVRSSTTWKIEVDRVEKDIKNQFSFLKVQKSIKKE